MVGWIEILSQIQTPSFSNVSTTTLEGSNSREQRGSLFFVSFAYGSFEGEPDYNPDADLNSDGIVDMRDLATVARNLGKF